MSTTTHDTNAAEPPAYTLTEEDKANFLKHGYIRVENCFTPEKAAQWTSDVWIRLGYSPTDKSTWTKERINMPHHRSEPVSSFAPKAWAAICELVGGEDRISENEEFRSWRDSLIVNLGTDEWEEQFKQGKEMDPKELDNWHVDGDFFWHFLDSPEQALLVIPLFSDIRPHGGGTMICPEGIARIARHLYNHPEGVSPFMTPRRETPEHGTKKPTLSFFTGLIQQCSDFHEMTGKIGDVILLHPFMLHSASRNCLREPRIITNPPVGLKEPFDFDREEEREYSLVERKTLLALGRERLGGWEIVGRRERIVPERMKVFYEMRKEEEERLRRAEEGRATVDCA
ncbi:uncharacterized protein BDV14DRAFT_161093 [Aspergillus stella-maris]|uniref:uncharacterized protein n=1 Tax=Aspergillus stella-maris TaxID=1810926 RepID=UPI003CCD9C7D